MSELILPPHIQEIHGKYWSTLTNKWIKDTHIKDICNAYWRHEVKTPEIVKQLTIYKKGVRKAKRVREYVTIEKPIGRSPFTERIKALILEGKVKVYNSLTEFKNRKNK